VRVHKLLLWVRARRAHAALAVSVVVLAAIAVGLSIAVIAGARPDDLGLQPTPTPSPTPAPSAPEPSARQPVASPTTRPSAALPSYPVVALDGMTGWARVIVPELRIRQGAGTSAPAIGALEAGDVVYLEEGPRTIDGQDWYAALTDGDLRGWVAEGPPDDPYLSALRAPQPRSPDTITGLAAGDAGFIAWGHGQDGGPIMLASANGGAWEHADPSAFDGLSPEGAAWGPAGWIAGGVEYLYGTGESPRLLLWQSSDGLRWEALDTPALGPGDIVPASITASSRGYVATGNTPNGRSILHSADGQTWTSHALEVTGDWDVTVRSVDDGFIAFASIWNEPPKLWFSPDGRTWELMRHEALPIVQQPRWAISGDHLVLFDRYASTLESFAAWDAARTGLDLSWGWSTSAIAGITGSVEHVAALPDGLVAVGWKANGETFTWTLEGGAWREHALPPGTFGGVPFLVASGPKGMLAAGFDATLSGTNGMLWHSADAVAWSQVDAGLATVESPTDATCPEQPRDAADLLALDVALATVCFGDAPISLSAFLPDCPDCAPSTAPEYEPAWLALPGGAALWLSPVEISEIMGFTARLHPDATVEAGGGHWAQVTGHFDDPAALECRYLPDAHFWGGPGPFGEIIATCRREFVVTEVHPLPSPPSG
jgi:hypothetical protein